MNMTQMLIFTSSKLFLTTTQISNVYKSMQNELAASSNISELEDYGERGFEHAKAFLIIFLTPLTILCI